MKTLVRVAPIVLATALGVALAGCSSAPRPSQAMGAVSSAQSVAVAATNQTASAADEAPESSSACEAALEDVQTDPAGTPLLGEPVDLGASDFAGGDVERDDQGRPVSYTVAPGDSPIAIGDRFCIDYVRVLQWNDTWPSIDPGELLVLRPGPDASWDDKSSS